MIMCKYTFIIIMGGHFPPSQKGSVWVTNFVLLISCVQWWRKTPPLIQGCHKLIRSGGRVCDEIFAWPRPVLSSHTYFLIHLWYLSANKSYVIFHLAQICQIQCSKLWTLLWQKVLVVIIVLAWTRAATTSNVDLHGPGVANFWRNRQQCVETLLEFVCTSSVSSSSTPDELPLFGASLSVSSTSACYIQLVHVGAYF